MERIFAVAVPDGDDLFIWLRLKRAAGGDICTALLNPKHYET
jgi:hypothetical protein